MAHGRRFPPLLAALTLALGCAAEDAERSCPAGDSSCSSDGRPSTESSATQDRTAVGRVFTEEELALHDGSDPDRPVLLALLGEVYDVSAGRRFYGRGGDYAGLSGRDGSRAFSTGAFENNGTASDVFDLDDEGVSEILGWRSFYRQHKAYTFQGVLAERYYDEDGRPTPAHAKLEAISQEADRAGALKEELRRRFLSCNTKHEAVNSYFEIWCDDGYHGKGSKPAHLYYQIPASGSRKAEEGDWCACVAKRKRKSAEAEMAERLKKPQHGMLTFRFADYPECNKKQHCRRQKGSGPP